ncbi:MAG: RHS repeat-associated core domain-containing protein, partial [Hafnia sp.]
MRPNRETLLCHYHYDPLDRLIDCAPFAQATTRRFYLDGRLATEIQGTEQRSIMQHDDQLLAQQQRQSGTVETRLLATDRQRSVLSLLNANPPCPLAYAPYGHRPLGNGLLSLLGFNGERADPMTGHYLLGNGYRAFNPVLMRFNSPDRWSPFGSGGLNAYAYCSGDAVNFQDPSGHSLLSALTTLASSAKPYFKTSRQPNTWNLPNYLTPKNMSQELIESVNRNQPSTKRILTSADNALNHAKLLKYNGKEVQLLTTSKNKLDIYQSNPKETIEKFQAEISYDSNSSGPTL